MNPPVKVGDRVRILATFGAGTELLERKGATGTVADCSRAGFHLVPDAPNPDPTSSSWWVSWMDGDSWELLPFIGPATITAIGALVGRYVIGRRTLADVKRERDRLEYIVEYIRTFDPRIVDDAEDWVDVRRLRDTEGL